MPTYVAFLRAINLGARRKFPKEAIRRAAEDAGFTDVETYINTGNVRVTTRLRSRVRVEAALEEAFVAAAGFEVPTIVLTPSELREVAADAARHSEGYEGRHYVSLLKHEPDPDVVRRLEASARDGEVVRVGGRAVHLLVGPDHHSARMDNAAVEKLLGVATNRNVTVIRALTEKWAALP